MNMKIAKPHPAIVKAHLGYPPYGVFIHAAQDTTQTIAIAVGVTTFIKIDHHFPM